MTPDNEAELINALNRIAAALEGISLKMANPYYIPNPTYVPTYPGSDLPVGPGMPWNDQSNFKW